MKKILLFFCLISHLLVGATSVDTIEVYSRKMNRKMKTVVITPTAKTKSTGASLTQLPSLYLLHGAFGSYANWVNKVPHIQQLADQYQMMIICPDGGYTSWYLDSPIDSLSQFETFVGVELPAYVDAHYPTIPNRTGRAITGLSMGGHGSIFLAFRHAETFSACGSMSGALNMSVITKGYGVELRLGADTGVYHNYWKDWSAVNVIDQYPKDSLAILMDCGIQDRILPMNRIMHEKMLKLKIPHEYTERPGDHNWAYWRNAIDYHALFFSKHFAKRNKA